MSKLIQLPYPQFVIFYNGTAEEPERQVLQLHEAFPEWANREEAALQCRAVVLNINLGYNSDIMYECIEEGILEEILRNNREEVCAMLLAEYDEQAHIESEREIALKEGIKEGEERMAKLIQLLMAAGRTEDVNRAIVDREYREQLYAEESL